MARDPGDKLGPRLAGLIVGNHLKLRSQLAPLEAKIAAAATQSLIDRAGEEIAGLWRPITSQVQAAHGGKLPPELVHLFTRMESGAHQWEAIQGHLAAAGTSALSSVISNALWPVTSRLNALSPQLPPDAGTLAASVAANNLLYQDGQNYAAGWGLDATNFGILVANSQAIPAVSQLYDMHNRGLIDEPSVRYWLNRSAFPPGLIDHLAALSAALISPADAALAVLRGNLDLAAGQAIARASGVSQADFQLLVDNTGEPPAIEELLLLWRRGQVSDAELERGVRQSRLRDEWLPAIKALGVLPPSPADVLESLVQGEVDEATARERFRQAGGDPTWFDTAYATTANSPAPVELAQMANRGIIPWDGTGPGSTSWLQGFREGRWKNKWAPAFKALAVYNPPPREIATLVREGGITQDQAMALWTSHGLTPELAHVYWQAAHFQKTSKVHELAQSEIVRLYTDRAITRTDAVAMLEAVNWTTADAEWLLDIADYSIEAKALEAAITKIRALYVAWKLDATPARAALATLDVPASQADQAITIWGLERDANVRTLTAAQIADAAFYEIIDKPAAAAMLQQIGYTAYDAWLVITIKFKGIQPDFPQP